MVKKLTYKLPKMLDEKMQNLGWDVRTLARVANVREQKLYDNLKGQNAMSLDTALRLVKALGFDSPENDAIKFLKQLQKQFDNNHDEKE